jgi:hypothetical protein
MEDKSNATGSAIAPGEKQLDRESEHAHNATRKIVRHRTVKD